MAWAEKLSKERSRFAAATAALETPFWRATSAKDNPNPSTCRRASRDRIFDAGLRRLPAWSSWTLTPACRLACPVCSAFFH